MKPVNNYKKILVFLISLSLLLVVAFYFLYRDIRKRGEHVSALSEEIDFLSNRQGYLISTEKMIENKAVDIEKINNSIVSKDNDVSFIESLETVAKANGLSITIDSLQIDDDPKLREGEISALKIKAKTRGTWAGTYAFISQIESFPYRIRLNKFSFLREADTVLLKGSKTPISVWQSSFEIKVLKYK